jgi:hypothetical protein
MIEFQHVDTNIVWSNPGTVRGAMFLVRGQYQVRVHVEICSTAACSTSGRGHLHRCTGQYVRQTRCIPSKLESSQVHTCLLACSNRIKASFTVLGEGGTLLRHTAVQCKARSSKSRRANWYRECSKPTCNGINGNLNSYHLCTAGYIFQSRL